MKKIFAILFSLLFHVAILSMFFDFSETIFQEGKWKGTNTPLTLSPIFVELSSSEDVEKYRDPRGGHAEEASHGAEGEARALNNSSKSLIESERHGKPKRDRTQRGDIFRQAHYNGLDKDSKTETAPTLLALIRKKIAEKQIYPPQALERGLSGTVKITFKINTNGNLDYTKISSSSGSQILDDSALLAVKKSIPLPYFPHAITLPIAYELK